MKVIIAGSTGMVGSLVLSHCLTDQSITEVVSLVRRKNTNPPHKKLTEVLITDFGDYSSQQSLFSGLTAAYFCIGVYTGQVSNDQFKVITLDYAVAFAQAVANESPQANVCLLSGAGADRTEKSRTAFAKFKGMAENRISAMEVSFYSFRPGYIYPVTPRDEPNLMYRISRALYPVIKLFGDNASIKSTELAQAIYSVGLRGANQEILENLDILKELKKG